MRFRAFMLLLTILCGQVWAGVLAFKNPEAGYQLDVPMDGLRFPMA